MATTQALFTNNATTTLASAITNSATSLTVASGNGALFPSPTGSNYFMCTLQSASGTPIEIIKVTARSTDTFTIVRAQESTSASAFSIGDIVELRLTAGVLGNIPQLTAPNAFTGQSYFSTATLSDAATIAWDVSTAQVATFTFVSSNRTMGTPTNLQSGAFYALQVVQNAGSNTLTWPSVFKWAGGVAPTLSTAAGAKDFFTFRSDGTNLYQQGISQAVA